MHVTFVWLNETSSMVSNDMTSLTVAVAPLSAAVPPALNTSTLIGMVSVEPTISQPKPARPPGPPFDTPLPDDFPASASSQTPSSAFHLHPAWMHPV